jgi:hypothetical protein
VAWLIQVRISSLPLWRTLTFEAKETDSFPKWSLDIVLEYLASELFVSARPITRQHKSVLLLGLASGARVSELHALSTREDCLHFSPDGSVTILPFPGFVAKLQSAGHQQISLRPLISNRVLCPVESLRSYLNMTKRDTG